MKKCTTFVFGGGGSHGALQVGAIRALLESEIYPDLLVGTSIGAVNAVALALWGNDLESVSRMESAWKAVSMMQMLDPRLACMLIGSLLGHPGETARKKVAEYFISLGITPELRFDQVAGPRLGLVSADVVTCKPVIFGLNPSDSVLEGLLASIAIPPWFPPMQKGELVMVDGGAVSSLPIEPALRMGATEIYAMDLNDSDGTPGQAIWLPQMIEKYSYIANRRNLALEYKLAAQQGVQVHYMDFHGIEKGPSWQYSHQDKMFRAGYTRACEKLYDWQQEAYRNTQTFTPTQEMLPA